MAAELHPAPQPLRQILRASWRSWWTSSLAKPGPYWLQFVWTAAFNGSIALIFTVLSIAAGTEVPLMRVFTLNMLYANCIGFSIHLLFLSSGYLLGQARLDAMGWWTRVVYYTAIPLSGVFIGYAIGYALRGRSFLDILRQEPGALVSIILVALVISTIGYQFFRQQARIAEVEAEQQRERARLLGAEKQALDAQLRALQAQIEPHFLFNTLANVVSLIDSRPDEAKRMLERLIDLLRGSLSASRASHATLGHELDLCRAYLDILAIRMRDRLRYAIDADASLRTLPLPPLLLQPLVENAIQHGLEPKVEGGRVQIRVRSVDGAIEITVEDDGAGFGALTRGGGVGLANLRERLVALYGGRARLAIEDATPGTRVRITLPPGDPAASGA
jgi:sensor histidine kinase YesM